MKSLLLVGMFVLTSSSLANTDPKKDEKLGDQVWEAAKQDFMNTVSSAGQEIKESGLYEQAAKVGQAIDEFAGEYRWIIPATLATSVIVMGRKAAVIALPFVILGLKIDITREKNKKGIQ